MSTDKPKPKYRVGQRVFYDKTEVEIIGPLVPEMIWVREIPFTMENVGYEVETSELRPKREKGDRR